MGIGRSQREEELEMQHREHLSDTTRSDYPHWVHEMYEHPVIPGRRGQPEPLRTVRNISRVLIVASIIGIIVSFICMIKYC